jgi:hypothetical protein
LLVVEVVELVVTTVQEPVVEVVDIGREQSL